MIDLDKEIPETFVEDHWNNDPECARLLIKYPELRDKWTKLDYLELSASIRTEHPELAEMLATI